MRRCFVCDRVVQVFIVVSCRPSIIATSTIWLFLRPCVYSGKNPCIYDINMCVQYIYIYRECSINFWEREQGWLRIRCDIAFPSFSRGLVPYVQRRLSLVSSVSPCFAAGKVKSNCFICPSTVEKSSLKSASFDRIEFETR